jgi:hypothetical protein
MFVIHSAKLLVTSLGVKDKMQSKPSFTPFLLWYISFTDSFAGQKPEN